MRAWRAVAAAAVTADTPGAAVMVIHAGRILHSAGYGHADLTPYAEHAAHDLQGGLDTGTPGVPRDASMRRAENVFIARTISGSANARVPRIACRDVDRAGGITDAYGSRFD